MRKKEIALLIILIPALAAVSFAQSRTIALGKTDGWDRAATLQNISMTEGRQGYLDLTIGNAEYHRDATTDALFHFDDLTVQDATGRWSVLSSDVQTATNAAKLGDGAAVFRAGGTGVTLGIPADGLFSPGRAMGDFSIEFWLYPVSLDDGSTILLWRGTRKSPSGTFVSQEFRLDLNNRHLRMTFNNLFMPQNGSDYRLVLEGRKGLIPRTWHHHLIRFDASDGLLEYLVDGEPEAIAYVTSSSSEGGSVYLPVVGAPSQPRLQLGPTFVGMLDELRLEKSVVTSPHLDPVDEDRGVMQTGVLDLEFSHSQLEHIDAEVETPGKTDVIFFYRIGNRRNATDVLDGDWVPFRPGTDFASTAGGMPYGRYLQVRAELLPDGPHQVAPRLHSLNISYRPDLPPMPPAVVAARAGNGQVTLTWSAVPEPT